MCTICTILLSGVMIQKTLQLLHAMTENKLSVIRSVDVLIFLRYTPSKRSVLLWVEKFVTSSMTWQKY